MDRIFKAVFIINSCFDQEFGGTLSENSIVDGNW